MALKFRLPRGWQPLVRSYCATGSRTFLSNSFTKQSRRQLHVCTTSTDFTYLNGKSTGRKQLLGSSSHRSWLGISALHTHSEDNAEVIDNASNLTDLAPSMNISEDVFATGTDKALSDLGELASMGLGSPYTPVGWVQNILETIHVGVGLPWWGSIVCTTVAFRLLVFPITKKVMVNQIKMHNMKPELDEFQERIKHQRNLSNPADGEKIKAEMWALYKKHDCKPVQALTLPFIQIPLFMSFFFGLRGMAYAPVESFTTGGMLWFTDLTVADPYCALPITCALAMITALELGSLESGVQMEQQAIMMKTFFRVMCLMIIPIGYQLPSAILVYWTTSNSFSLIQGILMRNSQVKTLLNIPEKVIHPPSSNPSNNPLDNFFSPSQPATTTTPTPPSNPPRGRGLVADFKAGLKQAQIDAEKERMRQNEPNEKNEGKSNSRVKQNKKLFKPPARRNTKGRR